MPVSPKNADLPRPGLETCPPVSSFPEVSVIVAVHNDGVWLDSCLRSVWQQGFKFWECIIIDDASLDDTLSVALRYAEFDGRFKVLRQVQNLGRSATRNHGIKLARGQFLTMLDGDDFLFQDSLEMRYRAAVTEHGPMTAGSWCSHNAVPEDAKIDWVPKLADSGGICDYLSGGDSQFVISGPMMRTDVVRSLGGFDESFHTAEDFEFFTRLFRNGFNLVGTGTVGVAYRQRRLSTISADPCGYVSNLMAVCDYMTHRLETRAVCSLSSRPYIDPVSEIPDPVRIAQRIVLFLVYAFLTGDPDQVKRMMPYIPDETFSNTQIDIVACVNSALSRHAMRGYRISVSERLRIHDEVSAIFSDPSSRRSPPPRRHKGLIDLSRTEPDPAEGGLSQSGSARKINSISGSTYPERPSVSRITHAGVPNKNKWDIAMESISVSGSYDFLTLGRELVERGYSVGLVDIGDNDVQRRARFEGVSLINTEVTVGRLLITSGPIPSEIRADDHLMLCVEPWLKIGPWAYRYPDAVVLRGNWERHLSIGIPKVWFGGWPSRAALLGQMCPVNGSEEYSRRMKTILVLSSPDHAPELDGSAFLNRYGEEFDFLFGDGFQAPPERLVASSRVGIIASQVQAIVVLGSSVPVDALVFQIPVVLLTPFSGELPDGVYRCSLEELGSMLTGINPGQGTWPVAVDWLAWQRDIVLSLLS